MSGSVEDSSWQKRGVKPFKLWRPTVWDYICRFILCDSFAWAVQNALGVLFTVLFSVIWRMSFTLSCVSTALYAAASQILSLDRTVGGRLFSGSLFVGCMLSGGVIGGAISSLAWTTHGSSDGLYHYFEEGLENPLIQNLTVVQGIENEQIKQLAGQMIEFIDSGISESVAAVTPDFILNIEEGLFNDVGSLFPAINSAYWILLIVFFAIVCIPFSVARAHENFKVGLVMGIATLFMGSQVVFATLTPILGIRQYWTQIVSGYIKVALVNGGAMCCTALLFFVKSSHDSAREQLGKAFEDSGSLLSRIASNMQKSVGDNALNASMKDGKDVDVLDLEESLVQLKNEVEALAKDAVDSLQKDRGCKRWGGKDEESTAEVEIPPVSNAFKIRGDCQAIEDQLAVCLFELPIPEVTSHVGARRADFVKLLESLRTMLSTLCCIESLQSHASSGTHIDLSPLTYVMAALASVMLDFGIVLKRMELFKPCKGGNLMWTPKNQEFWQDLEQIIAEYADSGLKVTEKQYSLSMSSKTRDLMVLTMNIETLIQDMKACQQNLCKSLDVDCNFSEKVTDEHLEKSTKEKIFGNAYLPSTIIHCAVLSGAAVYAVVILSCVKLVKGAKLFIKSKEERRKILSDRHVHYSFKYWLGLSLTIMSIVLILWKAKFSSENQLQNAYDLTYFFFVWQPIYFWLTAAICIQFQVEAAAFRAVLRTTMTAIGGTLGWFSMMNGRLAQDPVYIAGIVSMFNGVCGLISPIKEFRYSLFLTAFTFNAVVVCQYYGCCDLAGETNIYGGKVLSTLLGSVYSILLSWCILPYYTSTRMLELEYKSLSGGFSLLRRQHFADQRTVDDSTPDKTAEGPNDQPTLEEVSDIFDTPLSLVHKELELNVIDKRQFLLLTWTMLPTPKVVPLLMGRLETLGVFLRESIKLRYTPLWSHGKSMEKCSILLSDLDDVIDDVLGKSQAVVTDCKLTLEATSRQQLRETRSVLASSVQSLQESRAKLFDSFCKWDSQNNTRQWEEGELKFLARSRMLTRSVREINVIGVLLSETEATLDRDKWLSWASSWFGRRPV